MEVVNKCIERVNRTKEIVRLVQQMDVGELPRESEVALDKGYRSTFQQHAWGEVWPTDKKAIQR